MQGEIFQQKTGVLLINLGTPDHSDIVSVRSYLKALLSDPRMVDLPRFLRWLLLHVAILPFRAKKSAKAYQKIWLPSGDSPLLFYSNALKEALSLQLGESYVVGLGMRYGNPSLADAFASLQECPHIIIIPLFPQYSSAATGSALEKCFQILSRQWNIPAITILPHFYADLGWINACAEVIKRTIVSHKIDFILFSYHGLPEHYLKKSGCEMHCKAVECPAIGTKNRYCYRAQCYTTSRLLAATMQFSPEQYGVSFQSRLGRIPWIQPITNQILPELIRRNVRHLAVVCPTFVSDCVETLEEIGMRLKAQWERLGGKTFIAVPCVNTEPIWVAALSDKICAVTAGRK